MPTPEDNLAGIFLAPEGWWFPAGAGKYLKYLATEHDSDDAIKLLPRDRRRTCIQAGANVGLWPIHLARAFQRVITFEVEDANWICLERNLAAQPGKIQDRIRSHHAALGAVAGEGRTIYNPTNPAGHKFRFDGEAEVLEYPKFELGKYRVLDDPVPVMTIDSFVLTDVDAILLDIEGAELPALRGAEQTIESCRPPVILLEMREHAALHGYTHDDVHVWLRKRGYRHAGKVRKDQLFVPG